jgi:glutaconate CoA-transferase subunit A
MSEILTLSDAIARFVRPGATIALEAFTHLISFAAGHEVIRRERLPPPSEGEGRR